MGKLTKQPFVESCCDGGRMNPNDMSAQPCGCDQGANHKCEWHTNNPPLKWVDLNTGETGVLNGGSRGGGKAYGGLGTIKDSGKRVTYSSGSMRDPGEGKIKWSRITYGPMMRRWAQHLTTAEAKYPDKAPGVPNFSLIESEEEFFRYKESAFRHFMSWWNDETDEDHASACFFNINGVEIIKDKRANQRTKEGI